jgi:hypothetical protein
MLYIAAGDEGLIWICEWCHAGEPVLGLRDGMHGGPPDGIVGPTTTSSRWWAE